MKPILTKAILALIASAALAALVPAQQRPSSVSVLGKNDYQALLEAAPGIPATPADAAKRVYGPDIKIQEDPAVLDSFYAPFYKRVAAARDVIKEAVENRTQSQEALLAESRAQANASPIVSRMGGVDKISEMSDEEAKQAAAKAVGGYQQSLAGGPGNTSPGMQAMMERMMNDPAYQERFEKMTKQEQEAEMRKYMGNAPAPPAGQTAAERRAQQATNDATAVLAKQKELSAIIQHMGEIDAEFAKKDKAIMAAPGGHDQIAKEIGARVEKLPVVEMGESGPQPDPVKLQALQREQATRDRTRAAWELQQRAALYAQRKARSKELAASYAAWLKQNLGPINNQTVKLLDDSNTELAVTCEDELLGLSEGLAKYTQLATTDAAQYEKAYQDKMSGDTPRMPKRPIKTTN
jgi:hypothetical protein